MPIDPWAIIDTWPRTDKIGYYRGNALKYILRMGTKGDALEDVAKATHFMQKLAETLCEKK